MWIYPVEAEDLAHPKGCPDCGAPVILAKTQTDQTRPLNAGFKVLQTISLDGVHLQLVGREASHEATCEKKAKPGPPMTRRGRRKKANVDI